MRIFALSAYLIFVFNALSSLAQNPAISANDLARRVLENEVRCEDQDKSHWLLQIETKHPNSGSDVDEVIETPKGELQLPILVDGHPATKAEEEKAERHLEQIINNASAAQKSRKEKSEDYNRSRRMLKMLPDAFLYSYGARQGDRVQLTFKPNPRFRARGFEEEVFHAMSGSLWVDEKQNRLAEINGRLTNGVKFMGGLLGHLDKGGTFDVKQELIDSGYWELTMLNVHMTGKALFFKTISEQQQYYRKDFKRVPDNLGLKQAEEMLKREIASQKSHPAEKPGY